MGSLLAIPPVREIRPPCPPSEGVPELWRGHQASKARVAVLIVQGGGTAGRQKRSLPIQRGAALKTCFPLILGTCVGASPALGLRGACWTEAPNAPPSCVTDASAFPRGHCSLAGAASSVRPSPHHDAGQPCRECLQKEVGDVKTEALICQKESRFPGIVSSFPKQGKKRVIWLLLPGSFRCPTGRRPASFLRY